MGRKETHMFYVANIITFSVFLELLWKFTLLVRNKLNILRPPRVNQVDICALLFGGYDGFTPLDKVVYINNGNPALWQFINVTVSFDVVSAV